MCVVGPRVVVSEWKGRTWERAWTDVSVHAAYTRQELEGGYAVASKWISAAVGRQSGKPDGPPRLDQGLYGGRPALTDFMTDEDAGEGRVRELSVLMVCASPGGVRVGLKDSTAGGWLWREAASLQEGLDAIEKALQAGNVLWAVPGGQSRKKR